MQSFSYTAKETNQYLRCFLQTVCNFFLVKICQSIVDHGQISRTKLFIILFKLPRSSLSSVFVSYRQLAVAIRYHYLDQNVFVISFFVAILIHSKCFSKISFVVFWRMIN